MPIPSPGSIDRSYSGFADVAPFFFSSFAWNVALGMTFLLIPLYAKALGMSGVEIGSLIALPVILQVFFTLAGGALTDRTGGKSMALAACIMTCLSALIFMVSAGFALMFVAQLLMVLARAIFWPATWSLASELPGEPAKQLGRLNSATNAGQIIGAALAGFVIEKAGFAAGFGVMATASFVALVLNQLYRAAKKVRNANGPSAIATYRKLIKTRLIRYSILCGYIAALPVSLSFSFYPILLVEQGLGPEVTGTLMSLRPLGSVAAGFIAGYLIPHTRGIATPLGSAAAIAIMVAAGAAVTQPELMGLVLFLVGAGAATLIMYVQMLVGQNTAPEVRGSAMGLVNCGWGISLFTTPLVMGILKDAADIRVSFYVIGAFTLLCSLAIIPSRRWVLEETFVPEASQRA